MLSLTATAPAVRSQRLRVRSQAARPTVMAAAAAGKSIRFVKYQACACTLVSRPAVLVCMYRGKIWAAS